MWWPAVGQCQGRREEETKPRRLLEVDVLWVLMKGIETEAQISICWSKHWSKEHKKYKKKVNW